eukprot:2844926-Ditylum_brightwellii.AAC.1
MGITSLLPDTWRPNDLHKKFLRDLGSNKVRIGLFKYETSDIVCNNVVTIEIPHGIDKDAERDIASRNGASTMSPYYLCWKETMNIVRSIQLSTGS